MYKLERANIGKRVKTLEQMARAARRRQSIIFISYGRPRPIPASFVMGYQAAYLLNLLRAGAYVYIKSKKDG